MLKATYQPYQLPFKTPVLTSRGEMRVKNGFYLILNNENYTGIGECSFIEGLSIDNLDNYEATLSRLCQAVEKGLEPDFDKQAFPSIAFAYQTALLDLQTGGNKILFESSFTKGQSQIPINGLVWMGKKEFMLRQIKQKLNDGFSCIKIKVGAIDFAEELSLLEFIRGKFPPDVIEIRLDANGAFTYVDVHQKLEALAKFTIHSIEQPVKQHQPELMRNVCSHSPIPVALDEELIGIYGSVQNDILDLIKPAYLILKPSLLGGFNVCDEWAAKAEARNIKWWATSALESNIGLNAIAQWVVTQKNALVQGLGTGSLYTANVASPLYIKAGQLGYNPLLDWGQL